MGQRNNDLGRVQPRGVIGIEVGKHDKAGAIEELQELSALRRGPLSWGGSPVRWRCGAARANNLRTGNSSHKNFWGLGKPKLSEPNARP